ncbi:MAG: hypothetical protein Q9170_007253 [Blastenia crenularia]
MNGLNDVEMLEPAFRPRRERVDGQKTDDRDREELARLGKKQVLKRNFGFMSMLGFSCTMLVTWEGLLIVFVQGLNNGGPAGLLYGYILAWLGTLAVFTSMAELVSMAPTSSGQYHWVAMLAPASCQRFLSYLTGWLTVAGWQAFVASACYLSGTLIQGLIVLRNPGYHPKLWHGTFLFWAVVACAVFINTVVSRALPKIESLILVLHVLGFFAVLIPLVYLSPHTSAYDVFGQFVNNGRWPTQGLSFFVGLIGNIFAFFGVDGAIHMSEEIRNPSKVVPASMLCSVLLNGVLGLGMMLAVLFAIVDLQDSLDTATGFPFMEIFRQGTGSAGGSAPMIALIIILSFCATIAVLASSSRLTWAFARDRGLPGWRYLSKVEQETSLPLVAIAATSSIAILLSLISIGSPVALNDVLSLTVAGLFLSYFACCSLLLWRRCTGGIVDSRTTTQFTADIPQSGQLSWGPFHIPGFMGVAINGIGCAFLVIIIFFSFWPPVTPVTPGTMNYSVVVTGCVLIFSAAYYAVWAHKAYTGPVVEVVLHLTRRTDN